MIPDPYLNRGGKLRTPEPVGMSRSEVLERLLFARQAIDKAESAFGHGRPNTGFKAIEEARAFLSQADGTEES